MTNTYIEKDALNGASFDSPPPPPHDHTHEIKSFIATPRMDASLWERFKSLFKSELKPALVVSKGADGKRYMFSITSNSYEDRDDEIITSEALKAYEASCYPGEGLFHCDNPYVWWHDDDVVMGKIVAVNYSEPFLIEIIQELPTRTSKVLFDYAEKNGDRAGASHRFGYRDEDRQPDGSYTRIFKQESTYLPDRALAANLGTYAGVMNHMSSKQSDEWLNKVFNDATGGAIKNAAELIHAKSGALEKELAALGINHKAKAEGDVPEETEETEGDKPVDEKADVTLPSDFMAKLQQLEAIYQMMMDMVSAQGSLAGDMETAIDGTAALAKAFNELRAAEKAKTEGLEQRVKMLEQRLNLTQRRASQEPDTDPDRVKAALDNAIKQADDADLIDSPFGKIKPPIKY
jgi:hypothetical protein